MPLTEVMMLGGLGQVRAARDTEPSPRWTTSYLPPARTTPQEPQNLLRQTYMNGLGQFRVRSPAIYPGVIVTPTIDPARGRFVSPGLGPARFQSPGLGPGSLALFGLRGLGAGVRRTVAISLGRLGSIEGDGPTPGVIGDVDQALASYDQESSAITPDDPFALEKEILDQPVGVAQAAAFAADTANVVNPGGNGSPAMGVSIGTQGAAIAWGSLATVSALASLYHGYKRHERSGVGPAIGWGLVWAFMGATFVGATPVVALAQGFGKPMR
jgi:hypothetical protein